MRLFNFHEYENEPQIAQITQIPCDFIISFIFNHEFYKLHKLSLTIKCAANS